MIMADARIVPAHSLDIRCANQRCQRRPEEVGEGGWMQFRSGGYHCPICTQRFGVHWHKDPTNRFTIENLPR